VQVLLAGVKKDAIELRNKELEFNIERYTNLATQASVIAGFSFESLVELEVPEHTNVWLSSIYFFFGSLAMSISLYVLCIASFACIYGHRLALQGPHGSLEKAVGLMLRYRAHVFTLSGVALMNLVGAAICMSWIKMGPAAGFVTTVFLAFAVCVAVGMNRMASVFEIPEDEVVTGATKICHATASGSGAPIDLTLLDPGRTTGRPAMGPEDSSCSSTRAGEARTRSSSVDYFAARANGKEYTRLAGTPSAEQQGHQRHAASGELHHEVSSTRMLTLTSNPPPRGELN
jgi:uncharacterized membrane protein